MCNASASAGLPGPPPGAAAEDRRARGLCQDTLPAVHHHRRPVALGGEWRAVTRTLFIYCAPFALLHRVHARIGQVGGDSLGLGRLQQARVTSARPAPARARAAGAHTQHTHRRRAHQALEVLWLEAVVTHFDDGFQVHAQRLVPDNLLDRLLQDAKLLAAVVAQRRRELGLDAVQVHRIHAQNLRTAPESVGRPAPRWRARVSGEGGGGNRPAAG